MAPQGASKDADHAVGKLLYLTLCSAIAVSAMILPGISGSFIFLLLGIYFDVLEAVNSRDWIVIGVVALGGVVGLLAFTRLLNYVLERHRDLTVSFLIGLMLASLYGLWPFRSHMNGRWGTYRHRSYSATSEHESDCHGFSISYWLRGGAPVLSFGRPKRVICNAL